ncbi:unnamed protein product, partial [Candidula unifasciata]
MWTSNFSKDSDSVVFWALNGYGVTPYDLITNSSIVFLGAAIVVLNAIVLDTMIRLKVPAEPTDVMLCSTLQGKGGGGDQRVDQGLVTNLVTGLSMFYYASYNLTNYQIYIECLIRHGLTFGLVVSSVLHLTCLTCDRYIKIIFPFRYEELCKMTTVVILSALLWAMSVAVAIAPTLGWNCYDMRTDGRLYTIIPNEYVPVCSFFGHLHSGFAILLVAIFVISFFIMSLLYLHIFKVANRHARLIDAQSHTDRTTVRKYHHAWKYTKTVLIIMGLYFFCWLPVGIVLMMFVCGNLRHKTVVEQGNILMYATVTAYLNSLINPVVYALKITAVRTRFRRLFYCSPCQFVVTKGIALGLCSSATRTTEMTYQNSYTNNIETTA